MIIGSNEFIQNSIKPKRKLLCLQQWHWSRRYLATLRHKSQTHKIIVFCEFLETLGRLEFALRSNNMKGWCCFNNMNKTTNSNTNLMHQFQKKNSWLYYFSCFLTFYFIRSLFVLFLIFTPFDPYYNFFSSYSLNNTRWLNKSNRITNAVQRVKPSMI